MGFRIPIVSDIADRLPKPPSPDRILDGFKSFVARAGSVAESNRVGLRDTLSGIGANLKEAGGTAASGMTSLATGKFGQAADSFGQAGLKLAQTPVDAGLLTLAKGVSGAQTLLGAEGPGRKLTDAEIATLRKVYGDSLDPSEIRVKEGDSGLVTKLTQNRAIALGNTIYIPDGYSNPEAILVHEAGHVWQKQNGGTDYLSEAFVAQNLGDGYDFAKGIDEGKAWSELNPEQQAQLIQKGFEAGFFDRPGSRFVYGGKDYTDFLKTAVAEMQAGRGAP